MGSRKFRVLGRGELNNDDIGVMSPDDALLDHFVQLKHALAATDDLNVLRERAVGQHCDYRREPGMLPPEFAGDHAAHSDEEADRWDDADGGVEEKKPRSRGSLFPASDPSRPTGPLDSTTGAGAVVPGPKEQSNHQTAGGGGSSVTQAQMHTPKFKKPQNRPDPLRTPEGATAGSRQRLGGFIEASSPVAATSAGEDPWGRSPSHSQQGPLEPRSASSSSSRMSAASDEQKSAFPGAGGPSPKSPAAADDPAELKRRKAQYKIEKRLHRDMRLQSLPDAFGLLLFLVDLVEKLLRRTENELVTWLDRGTSGRPAGGKEEEHGGEGSR